MSYNPAPTISSPSTLPPLHLTPGPHRDEPTPTELYRHLAPLLDPEHPHTLAQLNVVAPEYIHINHTQHKIYIQFLPTVPHCGMATLIGLSIRERIRRSMGRKWKIRVEIVEEGHVTRESINKQLNDKERVAAALENKSLKAMVEMCLAGKQT